MIRKSVLMLVLLVSMTAASAQKAHAIDPVGWTGAAIGGVIGAFAAIMLCRETGNMLRNDETEFNVLPDPERNGGGSVTDMLLSFADDIADLIISEENVAMVLICGIPGAVIGGAAGYHIGYVVVGAVALIMVANVMRLAAV